MRICTAGSTNISRRVFERFFKRELDVENIDVLCSVLTEAGLSADEFRDFSVSGGPGALAEANAEAERDGVFGVPTIIVAGEPFWGNDRMEWVIKKLDRMGLKRELAA
jgi:2-hydroxychromene-2-carboxylate isomerase